MSSPNRSDVEEQPPDPQAHPTIAFADLSEPFTPVPLIADILRTRYCIPKSVFLVEGIETIPLPKSNRWRAIRLILGDGVLCIQALLRPEMHRFVDIATIKVGCYVRVDSFSFEEINLETRGKLVYLVVNDLVTVGWHAALFRPDDDHDVDVDDNDDDEQIEEDAEEAQADQDLDRSPEQDSMEDDVVEDSASDTKDKEETQAEPEGPTIGRRRDIAGVHPGSDDTRQLAPRNDSSSDEEADDAFETMAVTKAQATQRREQLARRAPVALPRDWTDPLIPLKLTPLASVPHLPYKQNWSINVLVVVTSLAEVQPFNYPPFVQRTARLADPSTTKEVHLTVFIDPEEFNPPVGSVVLLAGVKNHLFDGGSLKKYVSDKPKQPGAKWWFKAPRELGWCDVDGLEEWWEQKKLREGQP